MTTSTGSAKVTTPVTPANTPSTITGAPGVISCATSVLPGSLLDVFTPSSQCPQEYTIYSITVNDQTDSWLLSPDKGVTCYPSGWQTDCVNGGSYFTYSLSRCPNGYSLMYTAIESGTTTLACCESGLSTLSREPLLGYYSSVCMASFATIQDSTLLSIPFSGATISSTLTTVLASINNVVQVGYPIYVQFTSGQIPITGTTTLTPTATTTPLPVIHRTGLSNTAKYGLIISMLLLAIVLLLVVALSFRRLRRKEKVRKRRSADGEQYGKPELGGEGMPRKEMDGSQVLHEMPTTESISELWERPLTPVELE